VTESIGVGDPSMEFDATLIHQAAAVAEIHEFISELPGGYQTMLGREFLDPETQSEGPGVSLSGGQAQRIAVARSLYRGRRDLMVLDEPSASLDPTAEARFGSSLERFRKGGTSILISHRLGAIRNADNIVVLIDGQVAEHGTHTELVDLGGHYAEMFAAQASGYL
jgi:ATP-binding cassette, subfamily B, bacterial